MGSSSNPWLVEAALARLPQTLSAADQRIIVQTTRTPHKVKYSIQMSHHKPVATWSGRASIEAITLSKNDPMEKTREKPG